MKFDNKEDFSSFIKKSLEDGDFDSQIKRFAEELKYNRDMGRRWLSSSYPNESFDEYGNYKNWDWMKYGKTYLVTNGSDFPISRNDKRFLDIEDFSKEGVDETMPSLFFIYYGNQVYQGKRKFIWVAFDSLTRSNVWNMTSNGGECWVTNYIELNLINNSFLNWNKEPWRDLK